MAKVKTKKLTWTDSTAQDVVGYNVYWNREADGNPDYTDTPVSVTGTGVFIPDDIPSFPLEDISFIFGVSAIDDAGNESDIALTGAVPLDFIAPDAPTNVSVVNG